MNECSSKDYCEINEAGVRARQKCVTMCPRCGADAVITVKTLVARVRCTECGRITIGTNLSEAIEKWEAQNG